ncbi:MAG TPA: hypothetical protein VFV87_13105 [Pirellulaceae bacterium]|nr:hypothetical protein [Pirellulaceae bacterium]
MNKAFVRESDSTDVLCPRCGAIGIEVPRVTVEAHVSAEDRRGLASAAFFCPTPSCDVAYFDAMEATVAASALLNPVSPKVPAAPLCGCFGLTLADVEADVDEGTPRRIRELLAKSKSPQARCETASPTGRCCLPEVQRAYFKLRGEH